jgi:hypothetical protein
MLLRGWTHVKTAIDFEYGFIAVRQFRLGTGASQVI